VFALSIAFFCPPQPWPLFLNRHEAQKGVVGAIMGKNVGKVCAKSSYLPDIRWEGYPQGNSGNRHFDQVKETRA
jgi:hypothetical protein